MNSYKITPELQEDRNPATFWKCEVGGESYLSKDEVRFDASFSSGNGGGRHYDHICMRHYALLLELIDKEFPKNLYVREKLKVEDK